jgi:tripartite-type tricarboxylate transporter receptor subunit TctC
MKWASVLFLATSLLLHAMPSAAQDFPGRPVSLVVPYGPGSGSDIMGRALAAQLSEAWKQPVVVENRPGATTTMATIQFQRTQPDGYTLMVAPPPFVTTKYVYPNLPYDSQKDFAPISLVAYYPLILVVNPSLPIGSTKELVEYARKTPGVSYASPGAGTTPHLMGEMLARSEKLELVHVSYRSAAQGVLDLLAGRLQFYAGSPPEVIPHIQAGKLKAIAVLAGERSKLLDGVPTSTEAGYPYLQATTWTSIIAPKGTPKATVDKISADIAKAIAVPTFRERLESQGAVFVGSSPADLQSFYDKEHARFGPLVTSIGLKPEN